MTNINPRVEQLREYPQTVRDLCRRVGGTNWQAIEARSDVPGLPRSS